MINWDVLFFNLLQSRASGGQDDDYAISILLYPISQKGATSSSGLFLSHPFFKGKALGTRLKRAPQVLIVSRNIQPRVEIRENPTKGMRSIGKKK